MGRKVVMDGQYPTANSPLKPLPDLNSVLCIESYGHEEDIAEAIFTHKKELTVDKRIEYIEKESSSIKLKMMHCCLEYTR